MSIVCTLQRKRTWLCPHCPSPSVRTRENLQAKLRQKVRLCYMTVSKALSQTEWRTMERLCEITYAYVGKDYLLSGNTWLIIQCLKFKLGDLHWSPDILLLHTPPREHIYCLSSLFRYMCAICFCQIWKESCRPKMTSVWKSCTKTTMLHARTKSTLPWNNWWWVWVSLHSSFHLCSCSCSIFGWFSHLIPFHLICSIMLVMGEQKGVLYWRHRNYFYQHVATVPMSGTDPNTL